MLNYLINFLDDEISLIQIFVFINLSASTIVPFPRSNENRGENERECKQLNKDKILFTESASYFFRESILLLVIQQLQINKS